jgi:hypothetical protein
MLLHYGFDVTILEGRKRLGGRLHQELLPNGHLVDVGPNWIHGTSSNPILDLAKLTKTPVGAWDTRSYLFDEHGELFPLEEGEGYSRIMWDIILDAFRHSEKHSADISPDESLFDFFKIKILQVIPETDSDFERKRELVLKMAELWGAFVGSPITRQSLKFFWLEECIEGGKSRGSEGVENHVSKLTYLDRELVLRWHLQEDTRGDCSTSGRRSQDRVRHSRLQDLWEVGCR